MSLQDDILSLASGIKVDPSPKMAEADPVESVWGALLRQESGNSQFDKSGKPLTSKAGAVGRAQVMEATGPEAAQMAGLEWDRNRWLNDGDYNAAIGKAYLKHLYGRYGDMPKALAAYNGGMGRVDAAVQRARAAGSDDAWLSLMPTETRNYVPAILGGVGGQRSRPQATARTSYDYAIPDAPVPEATLSEKIEDSARALGGGIVGGVKMLSDTFGAGNSISRALDDVQKAIQDGVSDERKTEMQADQQALSHAELYGSTFDEIKAGARMFANAPFDTTLNAIGSSAPTLLTLVIPGANAAMATRLIAVGAMGAAQGAGVAKGSIYDGVRDGLINAGIDKDTAEKTAAGAQAYDGENGGLVAANGLMGFVASMTGADKAFAKALSKKIAAEAADLAKSKSAAKTIIGVTAKETAGESSQAGLERGTQNTAVAGVGEDMGISEMASTDPMQGVAGAMTLEGLAAGGLGAVGGAVEVRNDRIAAQRDALASSGVLGRAAATALPTEPVLPEPPTKTQDPLRARLDALRANSTTILDGLRGSNNGETAADFVATFNQASDPRTPPDQRAAMVDQMEEYARYAAGGRVPGMVFSDSREVDTVAETPAPGSDIETTIAPPTFTGIDGTKALADPNVIDAEPSEWRMEGAQDEAPAEPPGGAPVADPASEPLMTQAEAPAVTTPGGDGPAYLRKRKAQMDALAEQGFETVARGDDGFRFINTKTGQFFPLADPAEIALARKAVADRIARAANAAATSPQNDLKEPTDKQKEAGNYKRGERFGLNGFSVVVENPAGSKRSGTDPDGKRWESEIKHHYGDLDGVQGVDGDRMDVFVGPQPWNQRVFVVDQINPKTGKFDEHKVMMGFGDVRQAAAGYLSNYEQGWKGMGKVVEMSLDEFTQWTKSDGIKKQASDGGLGKIYQGAELEPGARQQLEADAIQALSAQQAAEGRKVAVAAAPDNAITATTNAFLDALERVTGRRGIAVRAVGPDAWDGVELGGDYFVNVDSPQMPIASTIAHEFKHTGEDGPGLKKLYDRMYDLIPQEAKATYVEQYLFKGRKLESLSEQELAKLRSEITADFMGKRFTDRAWLQDLAKKKPALFAEFVRDWIKLLDSLIGELKAMLGTGNRVKEIDPLMQKNLRELEEMKAIAMEVAEDWAKSNPRLAQKFGVDTAIKDGYIAFEVAPDPNDKALAERWRNLSQQERLAISQNVARDIVPGVLQAMGANGSISAQVGSYENDTNPSFALSLSAGSLNDVAKALGHVLSQDSMMVMSPVEFSGSESVGAVVLEVGEKSEKEIADIYTMLRQNIPEVGGQSYANGRMLILNYSKLSTPELAALVDSYTNGVYDTRYGDIFSSFPKKEEYGYGSDTSNGAERQGVRGGVQEQLRERLDRLRSGATQRINSALRKSQGGSRESAREAGRGQSEYQGATGLSDTASTTQGDADVRSTGRLGEVPRGATGRADNGAQGILRPEGDGDTYAQQQNVPVPAGRGEGNRGDGEQAGLRAGPGRSDVGNEPRDGADRPAAFERGQYGAPSEGSVEVVGYHYSQVHRETLNSAFYGTGLKGAERVRLSDMGNGDIRPRIYFYVDRGNGIRQESGVGAAKHRLVMRNMYDVTADPLGLVAGTNGKGLSPEDRASAWERAVMKAGFDGYLARDPIQPQWYAVLVGKHIAQPDKLDRDGKTIPFSPPPEKKPNSTMDGGERVMTNPGNEYVSLMMAAKEIQKRAPSFRLMYGGVRVAPSEMAAANEAIADLGMTARFSKREAVNSAPAGSPKRFTVPGLRDNRKTAGVPVTTSDGRTVRVDAKQALKDVNKRITALREVRECLL